jgi:hypothetical protein
VSKLEPLGATTTSSIGDDADSSAVNLSYNSVVGSITNSRSRDNFVHPEPITVPAHMQSRLPEKPRTPHTPNKGERESHGRGGVNENAANGINQQNVNRPGGRSGKPAGKVVQNAPQTHGYVVESDDSAVDMLGGVRGVGYGGNGQAFGEFDDDNCSLASVGGGNNAQNNGSDGDAVSVEGLQGRGYARGNGPTNAKPARVAAANVVNSKHQAISKLKSKVVSGASNSNNNNNLEGPGIDNGINGVAPSLLSIGGNAVAHTGVAAGSRRSKAAQASSQIPSSQVPASSNINSIVANGGNAAPLISR